MTARKPKKPASAAETERQAHTRGVELLDLGKRAKPPAPRPDALPLAAEALAAAIANFEWDAVDFELASRAQELLEDCLLKGDGSALLHMFLLFREHDEPVPEFLLLLLESSVLRAIQAKNSREVAVAFGLISKSGRGAMRSAVREARDRRERMVLQVSIKAIVAWKAGVPFDAVSVARDIAPYYGFEPDTAARYWRDAKKAAKGRKETP